MLGTPLHLSALIKIYEQANPLLSRVLLLLTLLPMADHAIMSGINWGKKSRNKSKNFARPSCVTTWGNSTLCVWTLDWLSIQTGDINIVVINITFSSLVLLKFFFFLNAFGQLRGHQSLHTCWQMWHLCLYICLKLVTAAAAHEFGELTERGH